MEEFGAGYTGVPRGNRLGEEIGLLFLPEDMSEFDEGDSYVMY